jgi:4-amino-4-deoxy-L-arabinose transferase-like glycosyltransferase
LFYWALAVCGRLFGFGEAAMRLTSVLSAMLVVGLVFWLGEFLFSAEVGFFAGLILASSFQFFIQAKLAYLEPLLIFFMTLSLCFFIKGYFEKKPVYYILFYAVAALAVLTKGIIGILLPAGVIFLFLALQKELKQTGKVFFNWGLLAFFAIVLPWYLIEIAKWGPAFWLEHFGYHQFTRFALGAETHAEPWYYNFVALFVGFLPWATFLPAGLFYAAKNIKQKPILLLILWAGLIFAFFTVSVSKLPGYLLPIFVPLSLLTAGLLTAFLKKQKGAGWGGMLFSFLFLAGLLGLLAGLFLYVVNARGPQVLGGFGAALLSLQPLVYVLGGGVVVALGVFLLFPKKAYFFWVMLVWVAVLNTVCMYQVLPVIESFRPMKPLGEKLAAVALPGDRVAVYNYFSRGLMFYAGRKIEVVKDEKELSAFLWPPGKAYVVMYDAEYEKVKDVVGRQAVVFYRANHGVIITNSPR